MKRISLIVALLLVAFAANAATPDSLSSKQWRFTLSGLVNPQAFIDTRQVVSGREEMMLFYPKPVELDADDNDLNAVPSFNMLAITARLALAIEGPDVLGAHVRGYIEGDYTGASDASINLFRLRHAYIDMRWRHHELLLGQYWYPMVVHEIMPATQPLNMGAPFHPYARYSQARYTMRYSNFEAIAAACFQLDNKSQGPSGASTNYTKRSLVPEFNLQLRYHSENLLAGIAYNLLVSKPRDYITDALGDVHKVNTRFASHALSLFLRYDFRQFSLRSQAILSDNLYEGCTLGGYVEYTLPSDNSYHYAPWHFTTFWVDFGKSKGHWQPGLFLGYAFNNDASHASIPAEATSATVYGRGHDIRYLYRVQPRIGYVTDFGLSFWFEVEHTFAAYLNTSSSTYDAQHPSCHVHNERFILGAVYNFRHTFGRNR